MNMFNNRNSAIQRIVGFTGSSPVRQTKIFFTSILCLLLHNHNLKAQSLSSFVIGQVYSAKTLDYTNRIFGKQYFSMPSSSSSITPGAFTSGNTSGNYNYTYTNTPVNCGTTSCTSFQHQGLDQSCGGISGIAIYSPISGVVTKVGGTFGEVCIFNATYNATWILVHSISQAVSVGTKISVGQYIGKSGGTGGFTPHVHTELRLGNRTSSCCPCISIYTNQNYDPRIVMSWFPFCETPSILNSVVTNANNVVLSWNPSSTNGSYQLLIKKNMTGAPIWTYSVTSNSITMGGFSTNTSYSFSVASVCNGGSCTTNSSWKTFAIGAAKMEVLEAIIDSPNIELVREGIDVKEIYLSPNPVKAGNTLTINSFSKELILIDVNGRTLLKTENTELKIPEDVLPGLYLMKSTDGIITKRLKIE